MPHRKRIDATIACVIFLGSAVVLLVLCITYFRTRPYMQSRHAVAWGDIQAGDIFLSMPSKKGVALKSLSMQLAMHSCVTHVAVALGGGRLFEADSRHAVGTEITTVDEYRKSCAVNYNVYVRRVTPRLSDAQVAKLNEKAQELKGTPYDWGVWSITLYPLVMPMTMVTRGKFCTQVVWEALQHAGVLGEADIPLTLLTMDVMASWRDKLRVVNPFRYSREYIVGG